MKANPNRLMITAMGSGAGKTSVTCALLNCLVKRNLNVCAFKSGPDYIDPMFHSKVLGIQSRNLDLFLCEENTVKYLFAKNCEHFDIAVVEGAMGIYDGAGFSSDDCSANHLAKVLAVPQILVVDVRGKGFSLSAEISGYINFRQNNIKGILFNHCKESMYGAYREMIEKQTGIPVYGYLPELDEAKIGSRHLGLITAEEISGLKCKLDALGECAEKTMNIDGLIALSKQTESVCCEEILVEPVGKTKVNIALAKDKAFCFYYEDNLALLNQLGANLIPFSPLREDSLPEDIDGLILGGGYPEEHIRALSENKGMLQAIQKAYQNGVPMFAECGGFMYLGSGITIGGKHYPLADVIHSNFYMTDRLVGFGYKTLTANRDNMFCQKGESIRCHEFHYSNCDFIGDAFAAEKRGKKLSDCMFSEENLIAGYPHLHFWSNLHFARNFVRRCYEYKRKRG